MLFSVIKSDLEPDTLANLSLECICNNLDEVFPANLSGYEIEDDMVLPKEICEALIETYQRVGKTIDNEFLHLFSNKKKAALQKVVIWNSNITDAGLKNVLQYNLKELDLAYCKSLSYKSFVTLNEYGKNLKTLSLGSEVNMLKNVPEEYSETEPNIRIGLPSEFAFGSKGFTFNMPNLTKLILRDIVQTFQPSFYHTLLESLPKLTHLDFSNCSDLGDLSYIAKCTNLTSLTLFNCKRLPEAIPYICHLTKLRHLDISNIDDKEGIYSDPNHVLKGIIVSLPNLISLDISGTNLAGEGCVERDLFDKTRTYHSDIPGLAGRYENHLEFVGLYGTKHGACKRHHIPAVKISGDADESQITTAATVYMNRPLMLQRVLNDLFHFLRAEACVNMSKVLHIILEALNTHAPEKHIQISGSAALFYIARNKHTNLLTQNVKNMVISTLINGMNLHINDETMIRNGCLTLCQFRIPQDILFVYNKLVVLLLHVVMVKEDGSFEQRIAIYLLNSLACQVNDVQKETLGELKIIEKMLKLINNRIQHKVCDDVLEVAWSTMWNVTDETPVNCERFLDNDGMTSFTGCLDQFRQKTELMRNMMGLLGNVAEVKGLRPRLMPYIKTFYDLVDSLADGIEVSYNAAGVISHIASDGEENWTDTNIRRTEVLNKMVSCINEWDLQSERNINYHSFEPILKLTRVWHTPECQHWAIWALANLTKVYSEKYCPILEAEDGIQDVQRLIDDPRPNIEIKKLAKIVMENYHSYQRGLQAAQPLVLTSNRLPRGAADH
ncbi:protein zer-1 homolog [Planococcus citri]|uniref:protein zer-1 homolog n=1 Tax=Planococcus citri TaxID=170843 RepID=UPI0031F7C0B1